MSSIIRRGGLLALSLFVASASIAGVAVAQEAPSCYPVPPGGCPEDSQITCEEIQAAIEDEDTSADQNGDGQINADDLPEGCQPTEEVTPSEEPSAEPSTEPTTEPSTGPTEAVGGDTEELAATGLDAGSLAVLALVIFAGGILLVGSTRRQSS